MSDEEVLGRYLAYVREYNANGEHNEGFEYHQNPSTSTSINTKEMKLSPTKDIRQDLLETTEISQNSSTSSSTVRVEIADVGGEDSLNLTTTALKRCKRQVLRPFWRLLVFIGWRGFGKESVYSGSSGWLLLNVCYTFLITLLLIYTYGYEAVACQWKLNVNKDVVKITTTPPAPTTVNMSSTTTSWMSMLTVDLGEDRQNKSADHTLKPEAGCEHIITTYLIPNSLHFIAFIMGMIHFRVQENEQIYALMEKVFLQATPLQNKTASQNKMIFRLRLFMVLGIIWVIFTLCLQILYEYTFHFPTLGLFKILGRELHWVMFGIQLVGTLVFNSVILAVIVNYIIQCEMILFYIRGLTLRLEEKTTDLKTAMKDILLLRQNISVMNGPIARMTSMITFILAELTIIGVSIIALNQYNDLMVWIYRCSFTFVWAIMLCFPLFQAANVNSVGRRLKKRALEIRVFGYKSCSQLDLDSFLNFVAHSRLRAKLFHAPILPSYLIATIVLAAFILLLLLQTGVIGPENHLF